MANEHTLKKHELMRSKIDTAGLGLEIGPGPEGVTPKRDGFNVRIADYANAEHLRSISQRPELIEDVDYVTSGGSVQSAILSDIMFDYIIASHVIEHVPDFIQFMLDCQSLLKPGGTLLLAVPDKRYIFDAMRPISSLGEIWQAHFEKRTRHPAARHFDFYAYCVARGGGVIWAPEHESGLEFIHTLEDAIESFEKVTQSPDYADIHAWVFTPSSFRMILGDLARMRTITLRETWWTSDGPEFFISLSANTAGQPVERSALMRQVLQEASEIKNIWTQN